MTSTLPSAQTLFVNISYLWPGDPESRILQKQCILTDSLTGIIQYVGPRSELSLSMDSCEIVDLSGHLVIPGFVNTHHHMYQSLTKCYSASESLFPWLKSLYPVWTNLKSRHVYTAAKYSMCQLLLSGCTLTTDMLYLFPNDVKLEDTIVAAREVGIRFQPCRGAMTESNGDMPPLNLVEDEEAVLEDMKYNIKRFHDENFGAMIRISLAPCSPFTTSVSFMRKVSRLSDEYKNISLHTHLAENEDEMIFMRAKLGFSSLEEYLTHCEWNRNKCWFAHCVHMNNDDINFFHKHSLSVAHCPTSNGRLGSGIAPLKSFIEKKVSVGIGVDGAASNDGTYMISEVKNALLFSRAVCKDASAVSVKDALHIATVGGARALGREKEVGIIQVGMCADFVAWKVSGPGSVAFGGVPDDAVLDGLVLAHGGELKPNFTVVNGQIVVKEGKMTKIDMDEVMRDVEKSAREIRQASLLDRTEPSTSPAHFA